jgi:hypothetical protein
VVSKSKNRVSSLLRSTTSTLGAFGDDKDKEGMLEAALFGGGGDKDGGGEKEGSGRLKYEMSMSEIMI